MRVCNPPIHMRQCSVVGVRVGEGVGAGRGIHICLMYMLSGSLPVLKVSWVNCCDILRFHFRIPWNSLVSPGSSGCYCAIDLPVVEQGFMAMVIPVTFHICGYRAVV